MQSPITLFKAHAATQSSILQKISQDGSLTAYTSHHKLSITIDFLRSNNGNKHLYIQQIIDTLSQNLIIHFSSEVSKRSASSVHCTLAIKYDFCHDIQREYCSTMELCNGVFKLYKIHIYKKKHRDTKHRVAPINYKRFTLCVFCCGKLTWPLLLSGFDGNPNMNK